MDGKRIRDRLREGRIEKELKRRIEGGMEDSVNKGRGIEWQDYKNDSRIHSRCVYACCVYGHTMED